MYQDLPGAEWSEDDSTYQVPCNTKLNISLIFRSAITQPICGVKTKLYFLFGSGIPYPIHPIDAVIADIGDNGTVSCYAAWEAQDNGREYLHST